MNVSEFEIFLQEHEKDIFSFCRYLTKDSDKADDLYQDTVIKAFENIDKIDITKNPKSFFFSIAVGKWKNIERKAARRNKIAPTVYLDDSAEEIIAGDDDPVGHTYKTLLNAAIKSALADMDDKYRIPIILFYYENSSEETISDICKIPKGTVKSRMYKGRAILKNSLERKGFIYE